MNLTRAIPPTRRRVIVLAAVMAVAGLFASASQAAPARAAERPAFQWRGGPKPVIVLEHGAWADASSWSEVIQRLQGDGFTVYAPPNPLRGLPQDSAYLHDFLTQNAALAGQPVVLVGHSYGGGVNTNAPVAGPPGKGLGVCGGLLPPPRRAPPGGPRCRPPAPLGGRPADP